MFLWENPCHILSPQGLRWSFLKCLLGWHMTMSFWSVHHIPLNVTGSGKITDQGRFIPCHKHLFCSREKLEKRESMVLPAAILPTGEERLSENGAKPEEDTSETGSHSQSRRHCVSSWTHAHLESQPGPGVLRCGAKTLLLVLKPDLSWISVTCNQKSPCELVSRLLMILGA